MAGEGKAISQDLGLEPFPGGKPLQAVWADASQIDPVFADQLRVTRLGDVYHLIFGQVVPPDVQQTDQDVGQTTIKPVLRAIVSRSAILNMARLLEQVLTKWGTE